MKRLVPAILFVLLLFAVPLHAVQIRSVDDVIRMQRAGMDAALLLAIVQTPHAPFPVTDADVAAMKDAGVPQEVIDALVAQAEAEREAAQAPVAAEPPVAADSTAAVWGDWCVTFEPPIPFYWPDYGLIPRWIWDPYWFMPRLDGTIGKATKTPVAQARGREPQLREPQMRAPEPDAERMPPIGIEPAPRAASKSGSQGGVLRRVVEGIARVADERRSKGSRQ